MVTPFCFPLTLSYTQTDVSPGWDRVPIQVGGVSTGILAPPL